MAVMLDLETLGTKPGCVVAAIGAVEFDSRNIVSEFYEVIDIADAQDFYDLKIEADTIKWWLGQSEEATAEIRSDGKPLFTVLMKFEGWLAGRDRESGIWGNGANFDNVILRAAFDAAGIPAPWGAFDDRCYRTLKRLRPDIKFERTGVHHHALDDARSQALHTMRIVEDLSC